MWCNPATLTITSISVALCQIRYTESSQYISVKYSSEELISMTFRQIRRLVQHYLHCLFYAANFLYQLIVTNYRKGSKTGAFLILPDCLRQVTLAKHWVSSAYLPCSQKSTCNFIVVPLYPWIKPTNQP